MKQGKSSLDKIKTLSDYHPPLMHYCSIQKEQFIRLVSLKVVKDGVNIHNGRFCFSRAQRRADCALYIIISFFHAFNTGVWMVSSPTPSIPSPSNFGWMMGEGIWLPLWITIPEVSKCTKELIKCRCTGGCTSCSCAKAELVFFIVQMSLS